jgi:prevent-host-death family protein
MGSKTVDIHDAGASLTELVSLVLAGNEVIIAEDNKPLARLVPISESKSARIAGLNRGKIWTSEDFDEALPESFWTEPA